MRRTFILHAGGSKLPTDLLGLTCVRYEGSTAAVMKVVCQKLRKAIENEGRVTRIEGMWWQFALTVRTEKEPSAVSILKISRDKSGALELTGRAWQEDGTLSGRYWSEAVKERENGSGIFWYWKGERPLHPDAPQLEGTGEMRLESSRGTFDRFQPFAAYAASMYRTCAYHGAIGTHRTSGARICGPALRGSPRPRPSPSKLLIRPLFI
jgi:hypothetical protein